MKLLKDSFIKVQHEKINLLRDTPRCPPMQDQIFSRALLGLKHNSSTSHLFTVHQGRTAATQQFANSGNAAPHCCKCEATVTLTDPVSVNADALMYLLQQQFVAYFQLGSILQHLQLPVQTSLNLNLLLESQTKTESQTNLYVCCRNFDVLQLIFLSAIDIRLLSNNGFIKQIELVHNSVQGAARLFQPISFSFITAASLH